MKIKVCGLKDPANIVQISGLEPDYMGFIFYIESKRYASPTINEEVIAKIPKTINKVGVFVNETEENIINLVKKYGLDSVQLHGDESVQVCKEIQKHVPVIKAFGVNSSFDFNSCKEYEGFADLFLFDTSTESYGGSGKLFDHDLLKGYHLETPFLISGGLNLKTATAIIENLIHPKCIGIDVNSRFEKPNGLKDVTLLKQLFSRV
ncbi:phosphoribosylanthranilate isomerase [Flavobacterium sp. C4GT6]|uniref:phosphoribosylanthranilate isomerase n=1 Tax=Flavobacterium sp. C4GT6 TaxID=3103818 RepID=UPI002ED58569